MHVSTAQDEIAHDNGPVLRRRVQRYRQTLRRSATRLRTERQMRIAAELQAAEKQRALTTICHDLRTPLSAILAWAQLARSETKDAQLLEALGRIEANVHLQTMLIGDILDAAKSGNTTLTIDREPVDLDAVVSAAVRAVQPAAAAKRVRLERTVSAPALVTGDATRLQRVVWNLLTNAVKFTPSGGLIHVALEAAGASARLRVSDTGCGIHPNFRRRSLSAISRVIWRVPAWDWAWQSSESSSSFMAAASARKAQVRNEDRRF